MVAVVNDRDAILAGYAGLRVEVIGLPPNVTVAPSQVPGLSGALLSVKSVTLEATSFVFQVPKVGAISPASIDLTATLSEISGTPTFTVLSGSASFTTVGNKITVASGGLTTNTATIQVSVIDGGTTYTDVVTIAKVAEGSDAVVGLLSNEACTVPASASGTVSAASLNASGGTFSVFDGIINKTTSGSVVYSVFAFSGVNISIDTLGVYSVSNLTSDLGTATLRAVYTRNGLSITIDKTYTIAKSIAGISGGTAKLLYLAASSQVFQIPKTGSVTPASITFTSTAQNLEAASSPVFTTSPVVTLTGTGATRTLAYADMTADVVQITVTQDGLTDKVTVVKVREGLDGANGVTPVTGYLTNEATQLPSDSSGNVSSYTSGNGSFKVFSGITDVSASATYSVVAGTVGITPAISIAGDYSFTNMTVDATAVTFQAVFGGVTIQKTVSLTKAKAAAAGAASKVVTLTADAQIFSINKAGSVNITQITFTAAGQNVAGSPVFTSTTGSTLTSVVGNTCVLTFANLTVDAATITVTWDGATDKISVAKVREGLDGQPGTNAISGYLTNEATQLPADSAGNVSSYTSGNGNFKVFNGVTDVTASATFSVVAGFTGITPAITAAGAYSFSNMTVDATTVTFQAVFGGVTIQKTVSLTKAKAAAAGAASKVVTLTSDSQIFSINKAGAVDRTQITFTATGQNTAGSPVFSTTAGSTLTSVVGNTCVLTYANLTVDAATVTVTWDGATDTQSVAKIREGADGTNGSNGLNGANGQNGVVGFLTNEASLVPSDAAGTVSAASFTTAGGTFRVFDGIVDKTTGAGVAYTVFASTNVTITINATTGVYVPTAMAADTGTATLQAVYTNTFGTVTIQKVYTIAKSKQGATGATGATGAGTAGATGSSNYRIYIVTTSAAAPAAPAATSNGATPVGWSANATSVLSDGQYMYQSDGFQPSGSTTTTWGSPYLSNLKVGNLSALSANLGEITAGNITVGSSNYIMGGQNGYASGAGFFIGSSGGTYKFSVGNTDNYVKFDGTNLNFAANVSGGLARFVMGTANDGVQYPFQFIRHAQTSTPMMYLTDNALFSTNEALRVQGNQAGSSATATIINLDFGTGLAVQGGHRGIALDVFQVLNNSQPLINVRNNGGTGISINADNTIQAGRGFRATGSAINNFYNNGFGVEIEMSGSTGYIRSYNRTTPGFLDLEIRASTLILAGTAISVIAPTTFGNPVTFNSSVTFGVSPSFTNLSASGTVSAGAFSTSGNMSSNTVTSNGITSYGNIQADGQLGSSGGLNVFSAGGNIVLGGPHVRIGDTGSLDHLRVQAGEISMGYPTNQGYKLAVSGNISASGNVFAGGVLLTSDIRKKRNIENLQEGLQEVLRLRPVTFNFIENDEANYSQNLQVGFIAQEVVEVLKETKYTECISTPMPNGTMTLAESKIIPLLVKAIQELKQELDTLKGQINGL